MLPIRDSARSRTVPVVTLTLIGFNVFVFLAEVGLPESQLVQASRIFGIVPRRFVDPEWARAAGFPPGGYWAFLTTLFLHGGWLHVIGNMWSLWIFGDNVEDRMGPLRFLLFYLLCGAAAAVVHTVTNPFSELPVIGASGAIAGVLGAYLVMFPMSRVLCLVPVFFIPLFIEIPAVIFIVLWIATQFYSGTLALAGHDIGNIAWWAHIGGFVAGLVIFRRFLRPQYRRRRLE